VVAAGLQPLIGTRPDRALSIRAKIGLRVATLSQRTNLDASSPPTTRRRGSRRGGCPGNTEGSRRAPRTSFAEQSCVPRPSGTDVHPGVFPVWRCSPPSRFPFGILDESGHHPGPTAGKRPASRRLELAWKRLFVKGPENRRIDRFVTAAPGDGAPALAGPTSAQPEKGCWSFSTVAAGVVAHPRWSSAAYGRFSKALRSSRVRARPVSALPQAVDFQVCSYI